MSDMKFIIIIMMIFFGVGINAQINDYDYNVNKTGIMYQENDNIVLNENNRTYDYNINYNLDESYLHYYPVKKGGLLNSLVKENSKNLASPDLSTATYLGNGLYRLYDLNGITLDYNVYSGVFTAQKTEITATTIQTSFFISNVDTTQDVFVSFILIENTNPLDYFPILQQYVGSTWQKEWSILRENNGQATITTALSDFRILFDTKTYNTFKFKLQIEKGDTATPYQVPYIPALKIDFKGTNQVEYINPFKEQIIEINDINNVNNIEFELLNIKNSVVFNWNITTNPNIPFVRFYNNQTKLLYDFTDVKEMNKIGNKLVGARSNIMNIFNGAIDIVDTFYQGFQTLFNKETLETIKDWLKPFWPISPPKWPWLK